jgi:AcrR family transcriptional regulator
MNQMSTEAAQACEKPLDRRGRRRAETRDRIIHAALCLFSERGVATTTVEDITNEADVGKGTFFNYFPSKEHILAHLCQLQMGKIRELVSRSIRSREPMDRVLHKLALILVEQFSHSPALVRSILAAAFSSPSARQMMIDDLEKDRTVLAKLMAARQRRGEIRDDSSPGELALAFQRMLFGTTVLWSLDPSKPLSDCLADMAGVLWSGIRSAQGPRKKRQ